MYLSGMSLISNCRCSLVHTSFVKEVEVPSCTIDELSFKCKSFIKLRKRPRTYLDMRRNEGVWKRDACSGI